MQDNGFWIEKYGTVTSTNDIVKGKANNGAPEGTVAIADAQTAGRGRMGRKFASPDGSGLYMSVLLRPQGDAADALSITTRAAVAVAKAIEKHTGRSAGIKWVNDIYQNGRKVCGILAEGVADTANGGIAYVVLGIGVNLKEPRGGFPEELRGIAGAIFRDGETFERDEIAQDILNGYFYGCGDVFEEYVKRDILAGKTVTVLQNGESLYTAKALGIDRRFGLMLRLADGTKTVLRSGEVSVRVRP